MQTFFSAVNLAVEIAKGSKDFLEEKMNKVINRLHKDSTLRLVCAEQLRK